MAALLYTIVVFPTSPGPEYPQAFDGKAGSVSGNITATMNGTVAIGGAYVAIVNATNLSDEYYHTTSDANGNYRIAGVNATYGHLSGLGNPEAYRIYANKSPYGSGYSGAFGIDADGASESIVLVQIRNKPARIILKASRGNVIADGQDSVGINAYAYDAFGNTVSGAKINLTVGNSTENSFTGNGFSWTMSNGSLGGRGCRDALNYPVLNRSDGISIRFGWIPEVMSGMNSTVWAYDTNDPNINASIKIGFISAEINETILWTGYVVDSFGMGYGEIPATFHIISANGEEIYTASTTTNSSQPVVGLYSFVYRIPAGADHGYVDASAQILDNLTIYGKSNNFSIKHRYGCSPGSIVLRIPPPDSVKLTVSPDPIRPGGNASIVKASLYLNGMPYHRSGFSIGFSSDNDSVAMLPDMKNTTTDEQGEATILLAPKRVAGIVNVSCEASIWYTHILTGRTTIGSIGD